MTRIARAIVAATLLTAAACAQRDTAPTRECQAFEQVRVLDGLPDREFANVVDVTFGPSSRETIYALDSGDASVWRFDGTEVQWIAGSRGEGPEEFLNPQELSVLGDSIAVRDLGKYGLAILSPSGAVARPLAFRDARLDGPLAWFGWLGGDGYAGIVVPLSGRSAAVIVGDPGVGSDTIASGTIPDTRWVDVGAGRMPVLEPFPDALVMAVSREGLVAVATGRDYVVHVYDRTRQIATIAPSPGSGPAVSDSAWDEAVSGMPAGAARLFQRPATAPAVSGLAFGQDQVLWVKTNWTYADSTRWDRWRIGTRDEMEGLGSVLLPSHVNRLDASGEFLVFPTVDDAGASTVTIVRILDRSYTCP